jgi:hypothetical protein
LESAGLSAAEALNAARAVGVSVVIDGDDLVLRAPEPPPTAVVAALSRNKVGIIALLRPSHDAQSWLSSFDERAAVIEYDGGAPRSWAEALARLDPTSPPSDISPIRWLRFIDDCGPFLDEGWALRAIALGWGPLELFGCNRDKPFDRISQAGLLWLLEGQKLVALTADTAAISASRGGKLTFYRRQLESGGVLAWDLDR